MNAYTELIDKYFNNEFSAEERKAFEKQLKTNPALKTEFDLQLQVVKGIQRMALKNQVKTSFKKTKTAKTITKAVIVAGITVAVLAGGYFVKKQLNKADNQPKYELNEEGKKEWSEADKLLPSQIFSINPLRDTVIESKGGILFAIQTGTFLNKFGETEKKTVTIEIREALSAFDIMKAGLSTTSDGHLLETGGMFYINAREGNTNLDIDQQKPIQTSVPYNGKRDDMMLFDGKREKNGRINWVNPVKTLKQLTTVDITKLNFYPQGYLDSLKNWGYDEKNKKFTDSLYYSFIVCGTNFQAAASDTMKKDFTFEEIQTKRVNVAKEGKTLFKANCAVCHSMGDQHLTGPGLMGIADRVPKGNWLLNFIKNSEKMIRSGDSYSNMIYRENGKAAMTTFEGALTDYQIRAIESYLLGGDGDITIPPPIYSGECPEINPSRIRAIWDPKFNNTLLATCEFEERLHVIFKTCNAQILELYIQNLDKDLYMLDSVAATLCSGNEAVRFKEFAKRHESGVSITSKQMADLQRYAGEKRSMYEKTAIETIEKLAAMENKLWLEAFEKKDQHMMRELMRTDKNFREEFDLNVKEAYRQVGKVYNPTPPPASYASAPITSTGWKNLDAYVFESTASRTTLDYTDPDSRKKAVIKYEALEVKIDQRTSYDRVMAYLVPNKLSSFQQMKEGESSFTENLNELMKYDIIVIGFKGEETFYAEIKDAKPQQYTLGLNEIKAGELEHRINLGYSTGQRSDLLLDFKYQLFEQKETIRQKKIEEREKFRAKLYPIVFPCGNLDMGYGYFEQ